MPIPWQRWRKSSSSLVRFEWMNAHQNNDRDQSFQQESWTATVGHWLFSFPRCDSLMNPKKISLLTKFANHFFFQPAIWNEAERFPGHSPSHRQAFVGGHHHRAFAFHRSGTWIKSLKRFRSQMSTFVANLSILMNPSWLMLVSESNVPANNYFGEIQAFMCTVFLPSWINFAY